MAGSQSFGKRENEKKKQAKRLEKQKRKEERQAGGTASLDEMIAWVDENGNLTDVPPEERDTRKEEIKLEDIAIATPKKEEGEADEPLRGRVEYFNSSKGYGFIRDAVSGEKYFFHISSAPASIAEGNVVGFELERGTRGMNAIKVTLIK
jgi:cold shock CspA family protein